MAQKVQIFLEHFQIIDADTPSTRRHNLFLFPVWAGFTSKNRGQKGKQLTLHGEVWQHQLNQVINVSITSKSC